MLIAAFLPTPEGGAERQCRRLATELARRGHRVRVVTVRRSVAAPRREIMDGVEVLRLGLSGPLIAFLLRVKDRLRSRRTIRTASAQLPNAIPTATGQYWHPTLILLRLDKLLFMVVAAIYLLRTRRQTALLHCHESLWLAGFAAWLGRRLHLPVVVKEATYPVLIPLDVDCPFRSRLETARRTAHYAAQTAAAAAGLQEAGIDPSRITLVPNGFELPDGVADVARNHQALFVGSIQNPHSKALDILFPAWLQVVARNPSARLTVVGGGDPSPWRNLLEAAGAGATVEFTGPVPDPAPYYRQAACLLLPSRREGLSNALLEAQGWGVPAVVSSIPGNLAVVQHEVNGVVVPVADAAALATAILDLLANPARRKTLGEAARQRASAQPTFAEFADHWTSLYRQLIGASDLESPGTSR